MRRAAGTEAQETERLISMLTPSQQHQEKMRKAMVKLFDTRGDFRRGIIMMEVLGSPKALRASNDPRIIS